MAPHSLSTLFAPLTRRSDSSSSSSVSPTIIIGFSIAGVIVLGLLLWLGITLYRRRSRKQRANERGRGSAFLTVKGVVGVSEKRFDDDDEIKGVFDSLTSTPKFKSTFSRANLTASIAMPSKARARDDTDMDADVGITIVPPTSSHNSSSSIEIRTPEEIIAFYASQGTMPKPFRPFSFALSAAAAASSRHVSKRGSIFSVRSSFLNPNPSSSSSYITGNNSNRGSMLSVNSSFSGVSVGVSVNGKATRDERGISYLSPLHAEYLGTFDSEYNGAGSDEKGGFGFGFEGDEEELTPPEPAFTRGERRSTSTSTSASGSGTGLGTSRFSSIRNSFIPTFSFPAKKSPSSTTLDSSLLGVKSLQTTTNRSSIFSISSYTSSKRSSGASFGAQIASLGQQRKILQVFMPILPDEPVVAVGEKVVLVHSFDDGWCVVGRKVGPSRAGGNKKITNNGNNTFNPFTSSQNQSKSSPSSSSLANPHAHLQKFLPPNNINSTGEQEINVDLELGTVPAWCFLPPVKNLRSERPIRSSSLGITVSLDLDADGAMGIGGGDWRREDVISWSNF